MQAIERKMDHIEFLKTDVLRQLSIHQNALKEIERKMKQLEDVIMQRKRSRTKLQAHWSRGPDGCHIVVFHNVRG